MPAESEEDFLVAMAHIADCKLQGDDFQEEFFDIKKERNKIIDVLLRIAEFRSDESEL